MTDLQPNTKEWYEYRLNGIGASDAPVIMGKSKYKTIKQLWTEKVERIIPESEEEQTYIQKRGHYIEAWARPNVELQTGISWRPCLFEHKSFPFIRATLDGFNHQLNEVWECKFMGKDMFEKLSNESLLIEDRIPEEYFDQLMVQLFCTGAQALRLTGVKEVKDEFENKQKEIYTLYIPRSAQMDKYINEVLMPILFDFWKRVLNKEEPELSPKDVKIVEDEELKNLLLKYEELKTKDDDLQKKAKKEIEKIQKEILGDIPKELKETKEIIFNHELRDHVKLECAGFKLTVKKGKESVDYESAFISFMSWIKSLKGGFSTGQISIGEIADLILQFPEEPNLEKYIKQGKNSFVITIPKKEKKEEIKSEPVEMEDHGQKEMPTKFRPNDIECEEIFKRIDSFKTPSGNRTPKKWKEKTINEKEKYLLKCLKDHKEPLHKKIISDLLEDIKSLTYVTKERAIELAKKEETVGGITFKSDL